MLPSLLMTLAQQVAVASHHFTVYLWEEHGSATSHPPSRKLKSTMSCPCRLLSFKLNKGATAPAFFECPVLPPHGHTTFLWSHSNFFCVSVIPGHPISDLVLQMQTHNYLTWEKSPTSSSWQHCAVGSCHCKHMLLTSRSTCCPPESRPSCYQRLYPTPMESVPREKLCTWSFPISHELC